MQTNNILRKALTKILDLTNSLDEDCAVDPVEIRDIAKDALAEPVKNCEVGTAQEQFARCSKFCDIHDDCSNCPVLEADSCELAWAQMPYKEDTSENRRRKDR